VPWCCTSTTPNLLIDEINELSIVVNRPSNRVRIAKENPFRDVVDIVATVGVVIIERVMFAYATRRIAARTAAII
jgi:prophage maintenance system killer protein